MNTEAILFFGALAAAVVFMVVKNRSMEKRGETTSAAQTHTEPSSSKTAKLPDPVGKHVVYSWQSLSPDTAVVCKAGFALCTATTPVILADGTAMSPGRRLLEAAKTMGCNAILDAGIREGKFVGIPARVAVKNSQDFAFRSELAKALTEPGQLPEDVSVCKIAEENP